MKTCISTAILCILPASWVLIRFFIPDQNSCYLSSDKHEEKIKSRQQQTRRQLQAAGQHQYNEEDPEVQRREFERIAAERRQRDAAEQCQQREAGDRRRQQAAEERRQREADERRQREMAELRRDNEQMRRELAQVREQMNKKITASAL